MRPVLYQKYGEQKFTSRKINQETEVFLHLGNSEIGMAISDSHSPNKHHHSPLFGIYFWLKNHPVKEKWCHVTQAIDCAVIVEFLSELLVKDLLF